MPHIRSMAEKHSKPTFKPRQTKSGVDWHVLMTHPSGVEEPIHSFTTEEEAQRWIDVEAEKWLAERR